MKDIELIDHTLGTIAQAGDMEIEIEARDLERICKLALEQVKNCSIPNVSTRTEMRKQAIAVFELTKGFTSEPTDNAMKTALEMADYVMRLTNDL